MINKTLLEKFSKALVEIIHNKNLRGSANYIICSAEVAEMIDNLDIKKNRKKKLNKIFESQKKE